MADRYSLSWKSWSELDLDQLCALLDLRQRVLVVEQRSPYADLDGRDKRAMHLLACDGERIVGYLRAETHDDRDASFGRLVVDASHRQRGLARRMVGEALRMLCESDPTRPVRIEAQAHLQQFYGEWGFRAVSEPYDDCGVEHVRLELPAREATGPA